MNWKLKEKIIDKFGTQSDFAQALNNADGVVSKVVRGRRDLDQAEQKRWADLLEADVGDLFG